MVVVDLPDEQPLVATVPGRGRRAPGHVDQDGVEELAVDDLDPALASPAASTAAMRWVRRAMPARPAGPW